MNLTKAIETLEDILRYVKPGDPPDEHDAIKLGIEALKVVREWRKLHPSVGQPLLPEETEGE